MTKTKPIGLVPFHVLYWSWSFWLGFGPCGQPNDQLVWSLVLFSLGTLVFITSTCTYTVFGIPTRAGVNVEENIFFALRRNKQLTYYVETDNFCYRGLADVVTGMKEGTRGESLRDRQQLKAMIKC